MQLNAHKIAIVVVFIMLAGFISPVFAQNYGGYTFFDLTITKNIQNGGTVSPGSGPCYPGQIVNAVEYPNPGYLFDGWFLNGVYQGKLSTIQFVMNQNTQLTATFSKRVVTLTITANPIGGGTTVPGTGVANYTYGDVVTVREYPNTGAVFSGWYLDGVSQGIGSGITVTMNQDHQLNAFFGGNSTTTPSPTPTPMPLPTPNPNLPTPILQFYCTSSTTFTGFSVKMQGSLIYNNIGVPYKAIQFSYSVTGGATWQDLAFVNTGDDGSFTCVWMPSASGNYMIRGIWRGDNAYSCVTNTVNFVVAPDNQNQNLFSVASNSTLSSLQFDSTTSKLSFGVSGQTGTGGFVQVCVPKTLLNDPNKLAVTLDGSFSPYVYTSSDNVWIIMFVYHHSSHTIVMTLDQQASTPTPLQHLPLHLLIVKHKTQQIIQPHLPLQRLQHLQACQNFQH